MATQATAFLRLTTNPTEGETVSVGAITYTFTLGGLDLPYEVRRGANQRVSAQNLVHAINGTGTPGTEYAVGTVVHEAVSGSWIENEGDADITFTAKEAGFLGNHLHYADTLFDATLLAWTGGSGASGAAAIQTAIQDIIATKQMSADVRQALLELAFDPNTV